MSAPGQTIHGETGDVPGVLARLRHDLAACSGLASALRVGTLRSAGSGEFHLRACTRTRLSAAGALYAQRIPLAEIEQQAWCVNCQKARSDGLDLHIPGNPGVVTRAVQTAARLLREVADTESKLDRLGEANVAGRARLLARHVAARTELGRWEHVFRAQFGSHYDEVTDHIHTTIQARTSARTPVSTRLHRSLALAAARELGIPEWKGALEEDEVLIALPSTPTHPTATQIISAYGLANPHGGTVVRGPRFLTVLLAGEDSFPQTTPAPSPAISQVAAALYEPRSAFASIAHCVQSAREALTQ